MPHPTVTVITPLHNGARFIERAVRTVQDQSLGDWRHIVINDRSTDGGDVIARELASKDCRLTVLDSPGPGAAAARNHGMLAADTRWIAFLDCDDYWAHDKLERQLDFAAAYDLAFSWSAYTLVDEGGRLIRKQATHRSLSCTDLLTKKAVIGCLTAIYDRERLGVILMPDIRMRQDMCLFAKILDVCAKRRIPAQGLNEPLAFYQIHSSNMTKNKIRAALYQWRAYRDVFQLPLSKSLSYFVQYATQGIMDRAFPRTAPTPPNLTANQEVH